MEGAGEKGGCNYALTYSHWQMPRQIRAKVERLGEHAVAALSQEVGALRYRSLKVPSLICQTGWV